MTTRNDIIVIETLRKSTNRYDVALFSFSKFKSVPLRMLLSVVRTELAKNVGINGVAKITKPTNFVDFKYVIVGEVGKHPQKLLSVQNKGESRYISQKRLARKSRTNAFSSRIIIVR